MRGHSISLLVALMLCISGSAAAQPEEELTPEEEDNVPVEWFYIEEIEEIFEDADMEFTLKEVDGMNHYEVGLDSGYTFTLTEAEDGYTFSTDVADRLTPLDGDWSIDVRPMQIHCPGTERHAQVIVGRLTGFEQILNAMMGSRDGGRTAPYDFTEPFTANQILDPAMAALERVQVQSEVTYTVVWAAIHQVQRRFMQPSDFTLHFKAEIGVVSQNLILAFWSGQPDGASARETCFAVGAVEWRRVVY